MDWITNKLPKEHESVFAKFKDSPIYNPNVMYLGVSNIVLVTIEHKGERFVSTAFTGDGKWRNDYLRLHPDAYVVAWMPYPEPYK